jgi:hypothetical protein
MAAKSVWIGHQIRVPAKTDVRFDQLVLFCPGQAGQEQ